MPNIVNEAFGIHEQMLVLRSRRMEVLASNIANADTPNYKARDLDFKAVLGNVREDAMRATHRAHFAVGDSAAAAPGLMYRVPINASADGNTVEMSVEQAQYGRAAAEYRATLNFIENRSNSIKRALRGE